MENEKNLNKGPTARELPNESLNAVAGGANSWSGSFLFKPGNKVRFTHTDNSTLYSERVVQYSYLKQTEKIAMPSVGGG